MSKGLIHVYTGDGKGKTTAAIGLAVRSAGHERKVLFMQFLKGRSQHAGEIEALKRLGIKVITFRDQVSPLFDPRIEISKLKASIKESIKFAIQEIATGKYDLVVLDEYNNLLHTGLSDMEDVRKIISSKPESLELVFTGRNAPGELIKLADYVTEIKMSKHPFENNVKARKGIEF